MDRAIVALLIFAAAPSAYGPPRQIATLADRRVNESSGLAASRRTPGLYWTLNDGGDPRLFLFDVQGRLREMYALRVTTHDIEDMAVGPGPDAGQPYLYLADIGDNYRSRKTVRIYRVAEMAPGRRMGPVEAIALRYPDGPHDAEAMFVHPRSGDLYIVTKAKGTDSDTLVFKAAAPLRAGAAETTLTRVASLEFPDQSVMTLIIGRVTGAAVSPDGLRVVLCDYRGGWEYTLPPAARHFDEIWRQTPKAVDLGARKQGEAVTYRLDGKAILATSERVPTPLIETVRP